VARAALAALAIVFTLAHLPYIVSSLDDIDSVNFALGIRDFDVAKHRPHPPGYPLEIGIAKLGVAVTRPLSGDAPPSTIEARTLSVMSLVGGVVAMLMLYRTLTCWSRVDEDEELGATPWRQLDPRALAATALTFACPLVWYLAVRPMSDLPGLAAALAAQAALGLAWWRQQAGASGDRRLSPERMAASGRMIVLGSLLAGFSIGFRAQNAVLTFPLLAGVLVDRIGRGFAGALIGSAVAGTVGALAWAVPLIVASGGVDAYLAALGTQAGEDFAGLMLYANPSPRLAAFALLRTFIFPWDSIALGAIVCTLAAIGGVALLLRDRRTLAALTLIALPYLVFHVLFQDTAYVRYALPLVPPVAFLAVCGLTLVTRQLFVPATGVLAIWSVALAAPVLASYGSEPSPTLRVLAAMRDWKGVRPGALALHQTFQRPLEAETVPITPQLPSPPRREWLELVRYWRDGHTEPIWFLADPKRSDLALIDPKSRDVRVEYAWDFSSLSQIGGMRPAAVAWYQISAPGWFADQGWALTPETAGMARLMGRGPSLGPITAWVRRRPEAVRLLVGGRHLGSTGDPRARFELAVDGRRVAEWESGPGFFVRDFELPAGTLNGDGWLAALTLKSDGADGTRVDTAIEQFDLQSKGALMWVYDEGWQEAEYDPAVGLWRWASDRSTLRIVDASTPIEVTLHVETPRRYFDRDPHVRLMAGSRMIAETSFHDETIWRVAVPLDALRGSDGRVTIETDLTFVPAERSGGADRRRLGLRVFGVGVAAQP
jgi:transmembrane protein TMEM260 (protein O-mannosyltransferase)